jgi:hypothetical protein
MHKHSRHVQAWAAKQLELAPQARGQKRSRIKAPDDCTPDVARAQVQSLLKG